jgi:pimeloyl-ACP methyl ester carboxylesterase
MTDHLEIKTDDGRVLEVLTGGDPDGLPWLYCSGTPSAAVPFARIDEAARGQGLRMITWSRPGYGGSTPRPETAGGPRIADDVPDVVAVLDHLGAGEFVTLGWSGGGPRALACGALLPDRCLAVATLAGVAPVDADGLDWFAGMAPENQAEFAAAEEGRATYAAYLERELLPMAAVTPEQLGEAMGELVTPVDRAAVTDDLAAYLSEAFRRAVAQGVVGAVDDGLAIFAPWGFDLASMRVPVAVWQGRQDAMVPFEHGAWLAAHVRGAQVRLFEDEGHLTLVLRMPEILADLRRLAGR